MRFTIMLHHYSVHTMIWIRTCVSLRASLFTLHNTCALTPAPHTPLLLIHTAPHTHCSTYTLLLIHTCPSTSHPCHATGALTQSTWAGNVMHPNTWTEQHVRAPGFWADRQGGPGCNDGALASHAAAAFAAIGKDPTWQAALADQPAGAQGSTGGGPQSAARRRARALLQDVAGGADAVESVDALVAGVVKLLVDAGDHPAAEEAAAVVGEKAAAVAESSVEQKGGDPRVGTSMTEEALQAWYWEEEPPQHVDFDNGDLETLYEQGSAGSRADDKVPRAV